MLRKPLLAALALALFATAALAQSQQPGWMLPFAPGGTGGGGGGVTVGAAITGTCPNGNVLFSNTGTIGCEVVSGTGTVTSATWTGGIVSIANPSTVPAFTIAGTSGGIPFFSSATTWASSGLLSANALMIGGGAGTAPSTTTTGTGVLTALGVNVGSAGAVVVNGGALGTPSSGVGTNFTGILYTALPALSANQVLGALTATTPSGQTVPACAGPSSALGWANGAGFACNTITGSPLTGTSGGVVYFVTGGAAASSPLLTQFQLLTGGGANAPPVGIGSLGTTTQVLHGNASGLPTFGLVNLATDVTGALPTNINAQTGTTYTVLASDASKLVTFANASAVAVTLPAPTGSFAAGFCWFPQNKGPGTATITPSASTINGGATLALTTNQGGAVCSDGANWQIGNGGIATAGSGTVTSVGFTGGLISVASPTTTPAFTVAGTSGGVPYFSTAATWASSAALAANALVVGGGAGVAPNTLGSLGTTTTLLHGNASGAPTFGAVALTTDVTGQLPVANGGTGTSSPALVAGANVTITGSWPNQTVNATGGAIAPNLQTFTTPGAATYTPTAGMKTVVVIAFGCGGGGGGGALQAASTAVSGGGAGGGGGMATGTFTAAAIGASKAISVCTAGTAGVAATTTTTAGGNGGAGGNTTFGGTLLTAFGGGGGAGGQLAAASGGGGGAGWNGAGVNSTGATGGATGGVGGSAGGTASTSSTASTLPNGGSGGGGSSSTAAPGLGGVSFGGGVGGGGGGGITAANAAQAGSNAFGNFASGQSSGTVTGGAVNANGNNGTAATTSATLYAGGGGASGGGGGISGTAGNGGTGGLCGGGSGGGGSMTNGGTAGTGGTGGGGCVYVLEY